jgi:putative tryptophan/tyrosine transport system substrate-binding protein
MRRRDFITLLGGAAAWVSAARAQEPRRVIGVLGTVSYGTGLVAAFLQGLKDTGFVEGQNVNIEYRWAESHYERMLSLATELIGRDVAVIVALDSPSAFAAKAATRTIPIVFVTGADPVKLGLVDSLNRPRGNLTGVGFLVSVLGPKHLELLRELLPNSRTIALLVNPSNPNAEVDMRPRQRPTLSSDTYY